MSSNFYLGWSITHINLKFKILKVIFKKKKKQNLGQDGHVTTLSNTWRRPCLKLSA